MQNNSNKLKRHDIEEKEIFMTIVEVSIYTFASSDGSL
jgi:hypothetical protein